MKYIYSNFLIAFGLFFLPSCKNKVLNYKEIEIETGKTSRVILICENDTLYGIEYYGSIKSKSPSRNYYFYHTGGIMAIEIFHPDSLKEIRRYYNNGILEMIYFEKIKNGIAKRHLNKKEYYPIGTLSKLSLWNEGIPIDTHWFYKENGAVLKYDVYNSLGNRIGP